MSVFKPQKGREYDQEINHRTLHTNPRFHEEEPQNTNSHKTSGRHLK